MDEQHTTTVSKAFARARYGTLIHCLLDSTNWHMTLERRCMDVETMKNPLKQRLNKIVCRAPAGMETFV